MQLIYHPASERGGAHHGWLKAKHTFNFADYYDPTRNGFGALKVLNDDTIAGGQGIGKHPHRNMEIITIPLSGKLTHSDDMGNKGTIASGDIQVMSAGSGVGHSEVNADKDKPVSLLQIWVEPNKKDVTPRYQQVSLVNLLTPNQFSQVLSPKVDSNTDDAGVWIYQNAWFSVGQFKAGTTTSYTLNDAQNGVYIFVIFGKVRIEEQEMSARDGLGIKDISSDRQSENEKASITMNVLSDAQVLLMEVPV